MPIFNDEEYLRESIDSILKQSLKDIEVICVNDGSTDGSLEILNEFSKRYDFIKVFTKENEGSGIARNYALTKATGEFIAYLDSDDIFINEKALELMYDSAIMNNALMVSANLLGINIKGELVVNRNLERFSEEGIITPQEYGIPYSFYKNIFDREFLLKHNINFPDLLRGQDPVFLAEIFTLVDKIPTVPVDLYGFRYPKTGSLLKINTFRKKYDYIKHFKETFDILDDAGFSVMRKNYEVKLFEFINAYHNRYTKEIKDIIYDIFKDDEDILNSMKYIFINPKVSVIVPIHNASEFLDDSISSILKQSLKEIELLCVDMASEDDSLDILQDFYQKDSRVRIINQENMDFAAARNRALDDACGDYIYLFGFDEYMARNILKIFYTNAVENNSDLVVSKIVIKDEEEMDYSYHSFDLENVFGDFDFDNFTFDYKDAKSYVLNSSFVPCNRLYKKEFLDNYDELRFFTDVAYEDIQFNVNSMLKASRISFVPKFFYRYSQNSNPNDDSSKYNRIFEICDVVERLLREENHFDEFTEEFKLFKITQINKYLMSANSEEYFQRAKKEYSDIDLCKNHSMMQELLKRYDNVLESDSFIEYKSKDYELRINEYMEKRDILKRETKKLKKENINLKKQINDLKRENEAIINSNSWKLTKILRKLKKSMVNF